MKSFARLSFIVFLVALLALPLTTITASSIKMTIECNPQAIDIDQLTEVFITLKDDEGKPVVGQNIFVGVTGIKGAFSFEMLTTGSEGTTSTTFTPQEYGMGYIIAKASIRQGTSILSITAETTIKVDNMNKPPTSKITNAFPNPVSVGETIQFSGEGDDIDGKVTEWKWDMGDGTVFTGTGDNSSVTHIYEKVGDYKVTFIVKDNSDIWSNPSWVTIKAYTNNAPQIAKVGEWETSALTGHEITISALITDSDSNLSKCIFDWGDNTTEEFDITGGSATLKSTHKYDKTGIYYLRIQAADLNGGTTIYPEEGWKINVYGMSKGGIKILFPDSAGEQIDFIGPFPGRDIALSKTLEDWGLDTGFTLLPGKYKLLSGNRTSALRPITGEIEIKPFKTSEIKCIRWTPKLATHIFINGKNPAKIIGKFYDTEGDIEKPALINISNENNIDGICFSANNGNFTIPAEGLEESNIKIKFVIDGIIGEKILHIPKELPNIKLTARPQVDGCIQLDVAAERIDSKINLTASVFSVVTGRRIKSNDVINDIPTECTPGITKLEINRFDSYKYIVRIDATHTSNNITSTDHTSFVPYIGDQKLHLDWGYSDDSIVYSGYLTSKESGEILTDQQFVVSKDGNYFGKIPTKNGLFLEEKNVSELLKSSDNGLELKISTISSGLTFEEKMFVRHHDFHPNLEIKRGENVLSFTLLDGYGKPIPGKWISVHFISKNGIVTEKECEMLGYPDSSVRTSINGAANFTFDDSEFQELSILIKTNVDDYPILKHFKIK